LRAAIATRARPDNLVGTRGPQATDLSLAWIEPDPIMDERCPSMAGRST
jgi:hypothetical protein